ncbi:MAG: hypothetical protein IT449_13910 [Phycisphaerales bacterium]|nr:hypothetical protein [Phycisphaerales bacterium]
MLALRVLMLASRQATLVCAARSDDGVSPAPTGVLSAGCAQRWVHSAPAALSGGLAARPGQRPCRPPAARAQGWDIGSGPTEAMCKNLTLRLKRPGMKRDADPAAGLMNLIALIESRTGSTDWETRKSA